MNPDQVTEAARSKIKQACSRYERQARAHLAGTRTERHPTMRVISSTEIVLGHGRHLEDKVQSAVDFATVCGHVEPKRLAPLLAGVLWTAVARDPDAFLEVLYNQGKHRFEVGKALREWEDPSQRPADGTPASALTIERLERTFIKRYEDCSQSIEALLAALGDSLVASLRKAILGATDQPKPYRFRSVQLAKWELLTGNLNSNACHAPGSEVLNAADQAIRLAISHEPACEGIVEVWLGVFLDYFDSDDECTGMHIIEATRKVNWAQLASAPNPESRKAIEMRMDSLSADIAINNRPTNNKACQQVRSTLNSIRSRAKKAFDLGGYRTDRDGEERQ